jgi:hypothetical protein
LKNKLELAKILDLEVFDDALSFPITKYRVKIFKSMTMFDGVMDRLLSVIHKAIVYLPTCSLQRETKINRTADNVLSLIKFNLMIFYSKDVTH